MKNYLLSCIELLPEQNKKINKQKDPTYQSKIKENTHSITL